jgi:hypothetical protein
MKYGLLITMFLAGISFQAMADIKKPTCDEEPTRRDCVKVEDSDAESTVINNNYNNKKKPVQRPVTKPRPKSGKR